MAAEQLSTELSGRGCWKAPHGAASGNNGDCMQPAGDHFSLMVQSKATVCSRKILNWWERRTVFRRRRTANQEELNSTLAKAAKLNRKPLLLLFFFLFLRLLCLLKLLIWSLNHRPLVDSLPFLEAFSCGRHTVSRQRYPSLTPTLR